MSFCRHKHLGLRSQYPHDFIADHRGILLFAFVTGIILFAHFVSYFGAK